MSLRLEDWKRILDQPKNLGMKAGGTGISEALRKVRDASNKFETNKTDMNAGAVVLELDALEKKCDEVINKHHKLFTSACDYLKTVKASAAAAIQQWERKLDRARKYDDLVHKAEFQRLQMKAASLSHIGKIESAKDLENLGTAWAKFLQEFGHDLQTYNANVATHDPDLIIAFEQARMYKPNGAGFEAAHTECVLRARAVQQTLFTLPPIKAYDWLI